MSLNDDHATAATRSRRRGRVRRCARGLAVSAAAVAGTTALVLAGLQVVGAQSGHSATEAAVSSQQQIASYFNEPGDDTIVRELTSLVDDAEPGSTIQAAQYRLWDEPVTTALAEAATERDVTVQIIVDHGTRNDGNDAHFEDLEAVLEEDGDDDTWVKICGDTDDEDADVPGCNGENTMHNKFFLFSETGQQADMVANSSANLSEDTMGGTGGWNNLQTISGNNGLYERFVEYFGHLDDVAENETNPNPDYYGDYPPTNHGNTKAYFYPRAGGAGKDTYLNSLRQVDCTAQSTSIRVNMWSISREGISEELHNMADEGCSIDIVASRINDDACALLTGSGNVPSNMSIRGFQSKEDQAKGTHQKVLMIDGNYVENDSKVVFNGSPNWNYLSWTDNDESVIRLSDDQSHQTFVENFDAVRDATTTEVEDESDCGDVAPKSGSGGQEQT